MTKEPLVSVIVPVYNVQDYLDECAESLLRQTYTHMEIILVDDGSTDDSGVMCDSYAARDSRVRVIHKANGGLGYARNSALDIARGEYVCFVDSDDVAMPRMIEGLLDVCLTSGAVYCQGRMVKFRSAAAAEVPPPPYSTRVLSVNEFIADVLYQNGVNNSVSGGLYEMPLWRGKRFRDVYYEDLDVFYRVLPPGSTVALTTEPVYLYRQHYGSILGKFTDKRLEILDVCDRMLDWIKANMPALEEAARTRRLSAHINMLGLMTRHNAGTEKARQRCADVIKSDGRRCGASPRAKRSLRWAMRIYPLVGPKVFARILAIGYGRQRK